jgi:hypothetical protein
MVNYRMRELIEEEFYDDPLFKEIKVKYPELHDLLLPDWIDTLNPEKEYTTMEVSGLLGKKDQNLRYYMGQLKEYVQPLKHNRNYRLTYRSIFKLHMIFLLIDSGRTVFDIRVILPMYGETSFVENGTSEVVKQRDVAKNRELNDELIRIFLLNLAEQIKKNQDHRKKLYETITNYLQVNEEYKELQSRIEAQHQLLRKLDGELSHLRATLIDVRQTVFNENRFKNMVALINKHRESSFFNRLKGLFIEEEKVIHINHDTPEIEREREKVKLKEAEIQAEEKLLAELEKQREELKKKMKESASELQKVMREAPALMENPTFANVGAYLTGEKAD